jgi:hypothetical protein
MLLEMSVLIRLTQPTEHRNEVSDDLSARALKQHSAPNSDGRANQQSRTTTPRYGGTTIKIAVPGSAWHGALSIRTSFVLVQLAHHYT